MHILINPYGFWENTMNYQGLEGLAFTFVPLSTSTHPLWCTCVLGPGTTTCTYLSPVSHNTPACLSVQCLVRQQEAGGVCVTATTHWTARTSDRIYSAAEMSLEVALECFKMLFKCQLSPANMTLCSPTRFPSRLCAPFTATWQL